MQTKEYEGCTMKMHCFLTPILKVQILGKCNRSQDPVSSSDIKKN